MSADSSEQLHEQRVAAARRQQAAVVVTRDTALRFNRSNFPERQGLDYDTWDARGRLLVRNLPSALTERQYRQVRTESFKEWFGDWETAPLRPPAGMTRLYRGETNDRNKTEFDGPEWVVDSPEHQKIVEASGRWFSESLADAYYYCAHFGDGGSPRISWVDVPTHRLEEFRASNQPEAASFAAAGMAQREFFLPRDLADSRKPFPDCSRIVDSVTGEPAVASHGTVAPEEIVEFNCGSPRALSGCDEGSEWGSGNDPSAYIGSHFARERFVAEKFARGLYSRAEIGEGRVYEVFLNVRNPKFYRSDEDIQDELYSLDVNSHVVEDAMGDMEDPDAWNDKYGADAEFRERENRRLMRSLGDSECAQDFAIELADEFKANLRKDGHDGIIHRNTVEGGLSYVILAPQQVKSATGNPGTFNKEDARIYDAWAPDLPGSAAAPALALAPTLAFAQSPEILIR